jgi:hypothetical protein
MARALSLTSERQPLQRARSTLERHWSYGTDVICTALGLNRRDVRLDPEFRGEGAWAGLVGTACERITSRNRGGSGFVVGLCALPRELKAWLGVQEAWDVVTGRRLYVFRHLSLTVYIGFSADPVKHQILRAEWPGIREWPGTGFGFQSPGAGHPHWQIDVLQTLREERVQASFPTIEQTPQDFDATSLGNGLDELVGSMTVERMHLASAASWWSKQTPETTPAHMNAPDEEASLQRWMAGCIPYLKQELGRCEFPVK